MIEFKGSHFERDVILWAVRWYVAYPISYRQLEEMMEERRRRGRPRHAQSLGAQICSAIGAGVSSAQAAGWSQLANGRDLCTGQGHLEIPVSGRRQGRCHGGFS